MTPFRAVFLAISLVGLGFFVGYGYQVKSSAIPSNISPTATSPTSPTPEAPQVKGLHASPNGKLLAFTGVYAGSSRAGVWVLNPLNGVAKGRPSPAGWQDFVTQWRSDGRSILLEREKIPRPVASAQAGIYTAPVDSLAARTGELVPVTPQNLPRGEKIVTALLAPNGQLVLKTRREPKTLFSVKNGVPVAQDHANLAYGQNRPVLENGRLVFYVVRDIPSDSASVALFRVENGRARQISPPLNDVAWSYVAPSGQQIIVARQAENGEDWEWTLYKITRTALKKVKTAEIPADVISVYWSSDEKRVLGAAGEKLWIIDVPSLHCTALGQRTDWNADDASWMGAQNAVAVASGGEIWRVAVPSGQAVKLWRFPDEFWN